MIDISVFRHKNWPLDGAVWLFFLDLHPQTSVHLSSGQQAYLAPFLSHQWHIYKCEMNQSFIITDDEKKQSLDSLWSDINSQVLRFLPVGRHFPRHPGERTLGSVVFHRCLIETLASIMIN